MVWWNIKFGDLPENDIKGILGNLDHYCELDTLVMVEIYNPNPTFEEANQIIDDYIYFYNYERIQLITRQTPYQLRCLSRYINWSFLFLSCLKGAVQSASSLDSWK